MVKLKNPVNSFNATGTLGGILTFGKLRKTNTLKKKATPKQPRSKLQISMRAMMQFLSQQWKNVNAGNRATWVAAYPAEEINNYNAFIRYNMNRWTTGRAPSRAFPAAEAGSMGVFPKLTAAGGVRHAVLETWLSSQVRDNWGFALFDVPSAVAPSPMDELIHITPVTDLAHHLWTQELAEPGIHYYNSVPFTTSGKRWDLIVQRASAIVT